MTRWFIILMAGLLCWADAASARQDPADSADEDAFRELLVEAADALQRDHLSQAEQLFQEALRMRPQAKEARFGIGALFIKQGRYADAITTMEALKEEFPNDFSILNNLAWLYATSTDHTVRNGERAIILAQEALLLQPNNFHVWNTLSEGHYVSGDYERALRAAQEALRLSREARVGRDRISEYQKQVDKCRRAAEAMQILD